MRGDDTVPLVHVITLVVCSILAGMYLSIAAAAYAIHRCAHHVYIPLFFAVSQFHPHTEEEPWNPPQGQRTVHSTPRLTLRLIPACNFSLLHADKLKDLGFSVQY